MVIFHIPHSSRWIPDRERQAFGLSDEALKVELTRMSDAYTDELFGSAVPGATVVQFSVSRLVVDPERFEDDAQESMAAVGMGVVYTRTSDGRRLRNAPTEPERERLLATYYRPHHAALEVAVEKTLGQYGQCLVIDCHSFPSVPLPYEAAQRPERPDICIGTDSFHTLPALKAAAVHAFEQQGWAVEVNRPFAGALVPSGYYRKEPRVQAVMVEVNRGLYMDERTGERSVGFETARVRLARALEALCDGVGLSIESI